MTETGKILEANGKNRVQFVFGGAGIITVEIKDIGNGFSEMSIKQTDIPTDEHGKQNYHVGCACIRNKGNDNDMND